MKLCKTPESQAPLPSSLQPSLITTCFISRSTLATNHNFTMLFRHQEVAWSRLYISVLWKLLLAELLPLLTHYQNEIFSDLNQPPLKLNQSSSQRFHQRPKCRVTMATALRWKKKVNSNHLEFPSAIVSKNLECTLCCNLPCVAKIT